MPSDYTYRSSERPPLEEMNSDDAKGAYERALAEATNEKQELLTWISKTDEFKPIGIVDPSPSQFQSVTRNAISNIDPASAGAADAVTDFLLNAKWIDTYGLKLLRSRLESFAGRCSSVKFYRDMSQ